MRPPEYLTALDRLRDIEAAFANRERLMQAAVTVSGSDLRASIRESAEKCLIEAYGYFGELRTALRAANADETVVGYDDWRPKAVS